MKTVRVCLTYLMVLKASDEYEEGDIYNQVADEIAADLRLPNDCEIEVVENENME